MIELKSTTMVHAFWFVPVRSEQSVGDWLACVLKQEGEDWRAIYRFRWHRDEKTFDSEDVKSWCGVTTNEYGEEAPFDLVSMIEFVAMTMASTVDGGTVQRIEVRGNGDLAAKLLSLADFAHMKPAEEPN